MPPNQRLFVEISAPKAGFETLPEALLSRWCCSAQQDVQFTGTIEIDQIIKSAHQVFAHHDLRHGSRPAGGTGKRALRGRVVFQAPFHVLHAFSIEQTFGLNACPTPPYGPHDNRRVRALSHAFRPPNGGFKIGVFRGVLSVGFIG